MELPHLGKHCSLSACKQLDFLPLRCEYCQLIFCSEHTNPPELHQCRIGRPDKKVPICPLCAQYVVEKEPRRDNTSNSHYLDRIMNEHIDSQCQRHILMQQDIKKDASASMYICAHSGCTTRSVTKINCPQCEKHHCPQHRWKTDHYCQPKAKVAESKSHRVWYQKLFSKKPFELPEILRSGRNVREQHSLTYLSPTKSREHDQIR
jgi:predicted nucleic acid binding AN1-type Zn finger protein